MAFSGITKIIAGVSVIGGAVATTTILLKDSSLKEIVPNANIGQYYLANDFQNCKPLLDNQTRNHNKQQIYACKSGEDGKLHMVYYEEGGTKNKFASKVKELKRIASVNLTQELRVVLEDSEEEKKLTWPLLFDYTDPGSAGAKANQTILNPSEDCVFTPSGTELFKCNDVWKVIKKR